MVVLVFYRWIHWRKATSIVKLLSLKFIIVIHIDNNIVAYYVLINECTMFTCHYVEIIHDEYLFIKIDFEHIHFLIND
jgi:hypothetical protein